MRPKSLLTYMSIILITGISSKNVSGDMKINPDITIFVNETTSEEIWNKFHSQIFTTTATGETGGDITELNNRRLFIKN